MFIKATVLSLVLLGVATQAQAVVTIEWVPVDNSSALTGYQTYDLFATTDNGWCCNAMLFPLDTGTFYQDPVGGLSTPNPLLFGLFPTLEFDTYLGGGGLGANAIGGAGDVGGNAFQFDETELDVSWSAASIPVPLPTGRLHMARLTFSNDASGDWLLAIAATEPNGLVSFEGTFSGTVADIVPEPASGVLLMLGAGLLVKQARPRRSGR